MRDSGGGAKPCRGRGRSSPARALDEVSIAMSFRLVYSLVLGATGLSSTRSSRARDAPSRGGGSRPTDVTPMPDASSRNDLRSCINTAFIESDTLLMQPPLMY